MSDIRNKAEKRVDEKLDFYKDLYSYIAVNVFLIIINCIFSFGDWWFYWVTGIWGFFLAIHFFKVFVFYERFTENYRENKIQEEIEKMKK